MCNFFITMLLERKIGIYTNHNRLYLWSHFQRYSHTCTEDIYTNLVKSSVSPHILISTHLYLLCRDDSRAKISREEHGHIYVRVYKISGAFIPSHRRYAYASDHKTLYFPCFFVYFSPLLQVCLPLTNKIAQNGLQPPIEDDVILHEMHPFFVQILIRIYSISYQLFIWFDTLLDTFWSSLLEMRTPKWHTLRSQNIC